MRHTKTDTPDWPALLAALSEWHHHGALTTANYQRLFTVYLAYCASTGGDPLSPAMIKAYLFTQPLVSRARAFSMFRRFFRFHADHLVNPVENMPPPKSPQSKVCSMTSEQLTRVLSFAHSQAFDPDAHGLFYGERFAAVRLYSMIMFAVGYGVHPGEMERWIVTQWDGRSLVYVGKADKSLTILPEGPCLHAFTAYLAARAALLARRAADSDAVFISLQLLPVSRAEYHYQTKKLFKAAGVELPRAGLNLFRHSMARRLAETGHSFLDVQQFMGHARPSSTDYYLRRSLGLKNQAGINQVTALLSRFPSSPPGACDAGAGEGQREVLAADQTPRRRGKKSEVS